MTERRPFPPSPRRRALARRAGLTATSPIVVGGVACGVAAIAAIGLGRAAAARLGGWIAAACDGRATLAPEGAVRAVLELVGPLAGAAALAALVGHVVQTRSLWLPRRKLDGVPPPARPSVALELACAVAIGAVAVGWLWSNAGRLGDGPAALASFLVALAVAWLVVGTVDALARHAALAHALAMTPAEQREDERLAGADPRWRAVRGRLSRDPQVAGAAVVLLGDDVAVAIAWDPVRCPVPRRLATGRRARATQLLGLARRHRVAVHRDAELAASLVDGDGPVPERDWPRLAEIVAAVRSR